MNPTLKLQIHLTCALRSLKEVRDHYMALIEARANEEIKLIEQIKITPEASRQVRREQKRRIEKGIADTHKWKRSTMKKWDLDVKKLIESANWIDGFVKSLSAFDENELQQVEILSIRAGRAVEEVLKEQKNK